MTGTGFVTAVAAGSANIVVRSSDGGFTDTMVVTVAVAAVIGVTVTPATWLSKPGDALQLTAAVQPTNAGNKTVTWTSSAPTRATVSSSGVVTAVALGTATITATTADGGFTSTSAITVANVVPVTSVTISPKVLPIPSVGATGQLSSTVFPVNASNKAVTYSSDNPTVATVTSTGLVTGVETGPATLRVLTNDGGFTDTAITTVTPAEWSMTPQTAFRDNNLNGVTWTGSNPVYTGVTVGQYGALILNTAGHNAIEFTVANGSRGMWMITGTSVVDGDFCAAGDIQGAWNGFGTFTAGAVHLLGSPTPLQSNPPGFGTGVIYRMGRSGTRVKMVRVDPGENLVVIWDGDIAVNIPTSQHYTNNDLGLLETSSLTTYTLPINCKTGIWTPP